MLTFDVQYPLPLKGGQKILMKNKLLYHSIAFLILAFCSCCTDKEGGDPEPLPVIDAPQEVKDYIIFKPGTYWIYKDSTTGTEDSVFVYDFIEGHDTLYPNNAPAGIYEWFQVSTSSALDGYDYYYKYYADNIIEHPNYMVTVIREKLKPGDYVGEILCFIFPPNVGYVAYWGPYDVASVYQYFDSYILDNLSFQNTIEIHETVNITENDQRTNFFFGKNYGIVRKELLDSNRVWNLTRCNIVQ